MKRIALAIVAGILLTFGCLLIGRYLRFNGHGLTAMNIFFPYSALVAFRLKNMGWLVGVLLFVQFPFYASGVSIINGNRSRILFASLLVVVHATAAMIALYLDHYGLKVHYI